MEENKFTIISVINIVGAGTAQIEIVQLIFITLHSVISVTVERHFYMLLSFVCSSHKILQIKGLPFLCERNRHEPFHSLSSIRMQKLFLYSHQSKQTQKKHIHNRQFVLYYDLLLYLVSYRSIY